MGQFFSKSIKPYANIPEGEDKPFTAKALHSFNGQQPVELPFKKGDILYIEGDRSNHWLTAVHSKTRLRGFIPYNYVAFEDGSPAGVEGWHDISRMEANNLLIMMGNPVGTYIVRRCHKKSDLALSVRCQNSSSGNYEVKHYRIRFLRGTKHCCIRDNKYFLNEADLIDYYRNNSGEIHCLLKKPYVGYTHDSTRSRYLHMKQDCIKLQDVLGEGIFGALHQVLWNDSVPVAHKLELMDQSELLREAEFLRQFKYPNILEILAICDEPTSEAIYIQAERIIWNSLNLYLYDRRGQLSQEQIMNFMRQICDGMQYLESKGCIHRKLRAANIHVEDNLRLKLMYFGLFGVDMDIPRQTIILDGYTTTRFPQKWVAPEVATGMCIYSTKSDVWSFGIVMYEIVTYGDIPYRYMTGEEVLKRIVPPECYRMPKPSGRGIVCSSNMYTIMLRCWNSDPFQRPTFEYLKSVFDNFECHQEGQYL